MLDVNLVVFIENKGAPFVKRNRRGRESRTKVFTYTMADLEYFPMLGRMKEIMESETFRVSCKVKNKLQNTADTVLANSRPPSDMCVTFSGNIPSPLPTQVEQIKENALK